MLNWLRIRNFALIEETDLEFKTGFNVITGETGAGKTILMQAVSLILGERADKTIIREGAESCEISAGIAVKPELKKAVSKIFEEAGLVFLENETVIRRVITSSSSRNFLNDHAVTLQTLKLLGDILIDTHGPHEHQSLLKQSVQLKILDSYTSLENYVAKCAEVYRKIAELRKKIEEFENGKPSAMESELLRQLVAEVEKAGIKPNEDEELTLRHKLAASAHDIIQISSMAVKMLNESEGSAADKISEIYRTLREFEKLDPENASDFLRRCKNLKENILDLSQNIQNYATKIELDEQEFVRLEERLRVIQSLKRKYGPTLDDVISNAEKAVIKLGELHNYEEIRRKYADEKNFLTKELESRCAELSEKRKESSAKFAKRVSAEIKKLGFAQSLFKIEFSQTEPGPEGADKIEFLFSANPGLKEQPLRSIASSGEISRVMLALKTVLASADSVPILIFDEIDVNIGGETAGIVGKELKNLGKTHQVLCISHLAQVAACADFHYKVEKKILKGITYTEIKLLPEKERKNEIGRMLGGTHAALKHAEDLLK